MTRTERCDAVAAWCATLLLMMLWTVAVIGCAQTKPVPPTIVVAPACSAFHKLTASTKDTPATKREIIEFNDAYMRTCQTR